RLPHHTFLSFHLQPRGLPGHRYHHASVSSDFRTSPCMSRLVAAPRRVEFVLLRTDSSPSGCSPRRFGPTQLPSATELWHTPARTFTVLMWCLHGRTHAGMDCRHPDSQGCLRNIHVNLDSSTLCWNDAIRVILSLKSSVARANFSRCHPEVRR